jgi:hypothetical protein
MLDLIIFIKSDGANANHKDLTATINSLEKNIGSADYKYFFVVNTKQERTVSHLMRKGFLPKERVLKVKKSTASWAYEYNMFFDECKKMTRYILVSHDDLVLKTKGLYDITMNLIKGQKDIGWMTFTCDHYYRNLGKPWGVSARMGFAKDRSKWPYIYECHNFGRRHEGKSEKNLHLLDMPESGKLVKIHSTYSCFNMVSVESMKKIGPCEDWTPYTMLIDEDWGLETLKKNLWNIWIPDVYYNHPLDTSRNHVNRHQKAAHLKFTKKWGFNHTGGSPSRAQIKELREEYKDTLFCWSADYNTYDWQYLEQQGETE